MKIKKTNVLYVKKKQIKNAASVKKYIIAQENAKKKIIKNTKKFVMKKKLNIKLK